ncbi:MAG TPA: hypothetical protein VKU01_31940 [Bryobacteraceae bacterium]|nr:hypothetical protein [Bryobacteraceae bacterium]
MNDHRLSETLRALAREGMDGAPPRVEAKLLREFRRRKRSQTAWRVAWIASPIAAAIALLTFYATEPQSIAPPHPPVKRITPPQMAFVKGGAGGFSCALPCRVAQPRLRRVRAAASSADDATPFYPLSYGDDSLTQEPHLVVRLEMQRAAMRLVGIAVPEERAREPIQADVVLGADGLARAVRFLD